MRNDLPSDLPIGPEAGDSPADVLHSAFRTPHPALALEVLDRERILLGLETHAVGRALHVYDHVASTNDIAMALADAGAPHGTAVVAERQTRGRGR